MAPLHSLTLSSSLGCLRQCPRCKYIAGWLDFFKGMLPDQRKEGEGVVKPVLCLPFSLVVSVEFLLTIQSSCISGVSLEWARGWGFEVFGKPRWDHRVALGAAWTQLMSLPTLGSSGSLSGTFPRCILWFSSTTWFSAQITWLSDFLTLLLSVTYFASEYSWALFF